jgi:DDE superfamily endonuclease
VAAGGQVPHRGGQRPGQTQRWTIAEQAGDRTRSGRSGCSTRTAWDAFAAIAVVRRFAVAGQDEAARRGGRRRGLAVGVLDETSQVKLRQALAAANKAGHAHVVIDGTLIPIDRVATDRPFYSGKHRRHGMNLQVIAAPDGKIVWVSGPLPGATHDLNAARIWRILRKLRCCPWKAGQLAKAIHVLQAREARG